MKITSKLKIVLKSLLSVRYGEVATDKAVLLWDGEEDLAEGMEVFVKDENDEIVPAEDGEYITEDKKTIVIVDGKVSEIKDPEAEVAPTEEPIEESKEEMAEEPAEEPAPADEPENEEENEPSVEERIASMEEKVAALIEGINGIVNSVAELESRLAEVEGKLSKVEAPAADPVDDEPAAEEMEKKSRLSYMKKR